MTIMSYLLSGMRPENLSDRVAKLGLELLAQLVGQRSRASCRVVVADQPAVALGQLPLVRVDHHLEVDAQRRALHLADPDVRAHIVAVAARSEVGDMAFGEDEAELL